MSFTKHVFTCEHTCFFHMFSHVSNMCFSCALSVRDGTTRSELLMECYIPRHSCVYIYVYIYLYGPLYEEVNVMLTSAIHLFILFIY